MIIKVPVMSNSVCRQAEALLIQKVSWRHAWQARVHEVVIDFFTALLFHAPLPAVQKHMDLVTCPFLLTRQTCLQCFTLQASSGKRLQYKTDVADKIRECIMPRLKKGETLQTSSSC